MIDLLAPWREFGRGPPPGARNEGDWPGCCSGREGGGRPCRQCRGEGGRDALRKMWDWLLASGHPDAETGDPDVAEECQEVDEEVEGEVDGGHVEGEGQGGQGRLLLLLQLRSTLHGIQLSCHRGWRPRGIGGRYYGWCSGRPTPPTPRQSLHTVPDFPPIH